MHEYSLEPDLYDNYAHARREYNPNNNRQGQNGGDALSDALIQKNNDLGVPSNNETPSSN